MITARDSETKKIMKKTKLHEIWPLRKKNIGLEMSMIPT